MLKMCIFKYSVSGGIHRSHTVPIARGKLVEATQNIKIPLIPYNIDL